MATLGELCEVNIGRTPARERHDYWGPGQPWLSIADMNQGRNLVITKETVTGLAVRECNCRIVAAGTVLLSFKLSIGKVGVARVPLCTNEAIAALPIKDQSRLLPEYLYWALQSVDLTVGLDRAAKGLTLNKNRLIGISIPVPPVPEQRRIAEILDKAEALRAKRRAALAQLEALTQSVFFDMFGDPTTNPKGWPPGTLGGLCEEVIDCPHSTPTYAGRRTPYLCVRSSDIQNGELDLSVTKCVEESEYDKRVARGRPRRRDVIYCREGARFGNAARVMDDTQLCLGQRMMLFRARADAAVGEYIWAFLSSAAGYRQATKSVDGSASPHVNIGEIVTFQLPKPPLALQHDFVRRIAAVDKLKAAYRASLAKMDALFASLQYRAFRGEL